MDDPQGFAQQAGDEVRRREDGELEEDEVGGMPRDDEELAEDGDDEL